MNNVHLFTEKGIEILNNICCMQNSPTSFSYRLSFSSCVLFFLFFQLMAMSYNASIKAHRHYDNEQAIEQEYREREWEWTFLVIENPDFVAKEMIDFCWIELKPDKNHQLILCYEAADAIPKTFGCIITLNLRWIDSNLFRCSSEFIKSFFFFLF